MGAAGVEKPDRDERQGVVHLVARGSLEDGEQIRRESGTERMRAERAGGDGDHG